MTTFHQPLGLNRKQLAGGIAAHWPRTFSTVNDGGFPASYNIINITVAPDKLNLGLEQFAEDNRAQSIAEPETPGQEIAMWPQHRTTIGAPKNNAFDLLNAIRHGIWYHYQGLLLFKGTTEHAICEVICYSRLFEATPFRRQQSTPTSHASTCPYAAFSSSSCSFNTVRTKCVSKSKAQRCALNLFMSCSIFL